MQSKKESNEKFYSLFEKLPHGVVYQDATGRIIEANPAAEIMLGLSLDQLQQRSSIDPRWHAIHPDGSPFPGETHPAMVSLRTGKPLSEVVMGIFNPSTKNYTWLLINSIPEFKEGEPNPYQVIASFNDITRQFEAEQKLKRQSELMELLVFTSTSFITIPEEKLKETINTSLQKLGEFVSADRMYVFDYDWEQNTCSNTYEWCAPEIEAHLDVLQKNSLVGLEDWTEAHKKGEMLYIHDVYSLPEESTLRQILEPQDIKSLIALPVVDDSGCLGFIGLDSVRKHHIYTENEITLLKTFAGILANVRNRLDRERQLKERIKELNSIYEVTNLTMRTDIPEGSLLLQVLEVIPKGFFDPDVTSVRITLDDKTLVSKDFAFSTNFISGSITTDLQEVGKIEVFLPEGKKFLPEEHTLIHAISNTLSQHLEARKSLDIIRKSESRFRNLVNSQTNYILRTDLRGFHTFWNKKFEEDFGYIYSERRTTEKDSMSSICEYDRDKARRTVIDCVQEPGKVFQVELDKPFETGEIRTTLWDFVCLPDSQGAPFELQCMGIDISDRKKIEKKLIESERKYRFLFEESPDGYLIIKDGKFIDCNRAAEKMLKGTKKDILGKTPAALSPEKQPNGKYSKDYSEQLIAEVIQKGHVEFEWIHLRKDGTEILIEIILSKIERDQEVTLFTTWRDVTEKRKTEHALINSEQRLSQIAEHSNSVIWEVDQNGIYSYISPVSTRIFGYTPEELVGKKHIWDLFPDDYNKVFSEHKEISQFAKKNPFNWEKQILRKDGIVIWVSRFGSAIEDESGRIKGYRGVDNDITSRKLAEEELVKFRMISDQASYGTVITETKTSRITYCNKSFAKMHGYEVQELIGIQISNLHTPEQLKFYFESIYPEFIAKGEYNFKEFERKRRDGSTFPGLVSAKQFMDNDGLPIFNASTVIDISQEKKISEQIQEQNLRLRSIIEAIPDILYIMDGEGNYLEYFSSSDANTIGDFSELVGKNLAEVYDEEGANFHLGKIKKTLANRKIETYEYSGMKGYQHRFFESRLVPMTENKVLRFVREISERKKSENEIKRLTLAIEQSPVAIVITDLGGNLEYFSPAFLQMTGYTYEELKGKPISIIKSDFTEKSVYQDLWKTISSGKSWSTEWRNKKKNGEIFWETVSITPILDEKKQIKNFLAVKQDNTEKKQYEQEILELNINLEKRINERTLELEKSNRQLEIARIEADSANQAKSEFLSRMSHELRTPMNSILGFAQLLELTELKSSQRKSLEYILKSGNHLLQLINEVLEISRIESGNINISLKPVELIGMIEEVIGSVMPFAANQSIEISFSKESWKNVFVLSDSQRLKQILINLLNNAIKYNKKQGKVKLSLATLPEEKEKKYIRINVEDTGIGISEEKIHKLFRPFERADQDHSAIEGTGLGLSVVEKLTKLMGGKVGVESQKGVGSKFWVELPITEEDALLVDDSGQKEAQKISSYQLTGKLLLVEDNIPNIELIRELLASLMPEIQLLTTMYGLEALEIAKESKPSLILLDLNLPDSNGANILEMLKKNKETLEIPVIVVSADATTKLIEEILEMGADQYITKPINIGQMIGIFHHYLKISPND